MPILAVIQRIKNPLLDILFYNKLGSDPICWSSKKQSTVATSTMEAEYIGTTECTKNVLWISVTKVSTSKIVAMVHWLVTMTIRLNLQGSTHTLSKI